MNLMLDSGGGGDANMYLRAHQTLLMSPKY